MIRLLSVHFRLVSLSLDGGGDLREGGLVGGRVELAGQVHEGLVQAAAVQGAHLH